MKFAEQQLISRILGVTEAGSYHLHTLLYISEIELTERIPTAAITCDNPPRLRFNPKFIETYCKPDEHLLMLLLHELYHWLLGHTRLPWKRPVDLLRLNIAMDAIVNSMLCHQFRSDSYRSFFTQLNDWNRFPARLLRPPPGWPDDPAPIEPLLEGRQGIAEVHVLQSLYPRGEAAPQTTIRNVLSLLESARFRSNIGFVLIGSHEMPARVGKKRLPRMGLADTPNTPLHNWLRENSDRLRNWFRTNYAPFGLRRRRGEGDDPFGFRLDMFESPSDEFRKAMLAFLRKACIVGGNVRTLLARRRVEQELCAQLPLPSHRDRRAAAWRALYGAPPIMWNCHIRQRRMQSERCAPIHVYLDISGSMSRELPFLTSVLEPPDARGEIRCFVFSTIVDRVRPRCLTRQSVRNTGGTDIRCVFDHLLRLSPRQRPKIAAIITDGFVGRPDDQQIQQLKKSKTKLHVALTAEASPLGVQQWASDVQVLPPLC